MVHPVPDGGAGDTAIGVDHIPILLEVTHRVAHGVGIFTGDERFFGFLLGLGLEHVRCGIAEVVERRITRMAVVERQTCAIKGYYCIVHGLDVWPHTTLVSETPEDDTRMVEVAFDQGLRTIDMGVFPCRVFAHLMIGITVTVRLLIGLIHDVDAPTVTKFIKVFAVRIVAGAQEVDVGLLHQP